jgi:hypothetical protein
MRYLLVVISVCWLGVSCKKDPVKVVANAEVFRFNPLKCGCCWGWYVKKGSDTLKIDELPANVDLFNQNLPIPIYIELGNEKYNCTVDYPYFEVKKLEIVR